MADNTLEELRIFCICGQKMKVSRAMFGLPGKCVACRQKIRVPKPDELPQGTVEVFLKDFPQFLRKSQGAGAGSGGKGAGVDEGEAVVLGEPADRVLATALDIIEPLRILCSLNHKITRQLEAIALGSAAGNDKDREALTSYAERVGNARADLDDHFRQRLMEVTIELSSVEEKVVQADLSVRIGEMDLGEYRMSVDHLRRRRDYLERQQQNLRGWLATTDPHTAGGYVNVAIDSIPPEGFSLTLPGEPQDARSLLDHYLGELRDALSRRERAERRLKEIEQLQAEGSMSPTVLADCRADCLAEKRRAEAGVAFCRTRLEHLGDDAAQDIQVVQACLELAKKERQEGKLDDAGFRSREEHLVEIQRDCAKAHDVAQRALVAGSVQDVPYPKGSFIRRMPKPKAAVMPTVTNVDAVVELATALVLGLSVCLPLFGGFSIFEAFRMAGPGEHFTRWLLLTPVITGVFVTIVVALPSRELRGVLIALIWLAFTVSGFAMLREAEFSQTGLSVKFREGGFWLFRPGMVVMLLANIALLVSAWLAVGRQRGYRRFLGVTMGVCVVCLVAVFSDFAGAAFPEPEVTVDWRAVEDDGGGYHDASVTVCNTGSRTLLISDRARTSRGAYRYVMERQGIGADWETQDATPDDIESVKDGEVIPLGDARHMALTPGQGVVFRYRLRPGTYRISLAPRMQRKETVRNEFTLPELRRANRPSTPAAAVARREPVVREVDEVASASPQEVEKPRVESENRGRTVPSGVFAELRGVITAEGKAPRFSIILYAPGRDPRTLDLVLGEEVFGGWIVDEYNPSRQTVTLSDGARILILNLGERIGFDR